MHLERPVDRKLSEPRSAWLKLVIAVLGVSAIIAVPLIKEKPDGLSLGAAIGISVAFAATATLIVVGFDLIRRRGRWWRRAIERMWLVLFCVMAPVGVLLMLCGIIMGTLKLLGLAP